MLGAGKQVAIALLLLIGAGVAGVQYCYRLETQVNIYATHADALADGSGARGWLPAYVPTSAQAIREVHDLDSNNQWLRFQAP